MEETKVAARLDQLFALFLEDLDSFLVLEKTYLDSSLAFPGSRRDMVEQRPDPWGTRVNGC